MPSNSSRLIQEYISLCITGLRQSKIIQEKDNKGNEIPKVFGLIYIFVSVAMSATKSILPETEIFASNMIHHEEKANPLQKISPTLLTPWNPT